MDEKIVQGYLYDNGGHPQYQEYNDTVCKIVKRADANEHELLELGPAFLVVFGDGTQFVAFASELSPWYPT